MKLMITFIDEDKDEYYLAHQPVVKKESVTTKVCPVFEISIKSPNRVDLKDDPTKSSSKCRMIWRRL